MSGMFSEAYSFNQPIENWNTEKVIKMGSMFNGAYSFNQSLSKWNVGKAKEMRFMFAHAESFNQSIGYWNIESATDMTGILYRSGLNTENYDSTLIGWSKNKNVPKNIILNSNGLNYCKSKEARQKLIDEHSWTIEGDKFSCKDD